MITPPANTQIYKGEIADYWFDEGIYLLSSDVEYSDLIPSRLIRINDVDIEEVEKKLSSIIPGNPAQVKKVIPEYLCSPAILHGMKIISHRDACLFTFINADGDTIKRKTETKLREKIKADSIQLGDKLLRNQSRDNYWYKYDSLSNSLYFNYISCINDRKKPFDKFTEELFLELESHDTKRLIIDLRYNSGGSEPLLFPVIERLWKTKVRKQKGLFVLIGRRTFSSAVLNAFGLQSKDDAILVGEETGGSINHFGEIKVFELPNSRLRVAYSTKYFLRERSKTGSLKPDQMIPVKFSDFINGVDPALDYTETH